MLIHLMEQLNCGEKQTEKSFLKLITMFSSSFLYYYFNFSFCVFNFFRIHTYAYMQDVSKWLSTRKKRERCLVDCGWQKKNFFLSRKCEQFLMYLNMLAVSSEHVVVAQFFFCFSYSHHVLSDKKKSLFKSFNQLSEQFCLLFELLFPFFCFHCDDNKHNVNNFYGTWQKT